MDEPRQHRIIRRRDVTRRQLALVPRVADVEPLQPEPGAPPRSIGRLIAQTALIADSALARRRGRSEQPLRNAARPGRRFGWFF